jgi:hypothetical protein
MTGDRESDFGPTAERPRAEAISCMQREKWENSAIDISAGHQKFPFLS